MEQSTDIRPADFNLLPHDAKVLIARERMRHMPQVFIPTRTFEGHGMVTRVMMAPAGTCMIGRKHFQGQHNFLMVGTIELSTEDGPVRLTAPEVIVSPPGTRRAAIALTDVVWATTIATDLSAEEAEKKLVEPLPDMPKVEEEPKP